MPVSRKLGEAIGKLIRNLTEPKWYLAEASKQALSIYVINPQGYKVSAYLKGYLFGPEKDKYGNVISENHIGDVYKCSDNNEYLSIGNNQYRYDPRTDSWINATPPLRKT